MDTTFPIGWSAETLERLAGEIKEIADKTRPVGPGILSRWLHGPKYTDIFVDIAPGGEIDRLEVTFGGHWLLFQNGHLTTGVTDEMKIHDSAPKSKMIEQHHSIEAPVLRAVRVLLMHIHDPYLSKTLLDLLPLPPTVAS